MAKKKAGGKAQKRKGGGALAWLFALSVIVIFVLVVQLQEKDKRIAALTKREHPETRRNLEDAGQDPSGTGFDKERIKRQAETALPRLIGKAPPAGSSWNLDNVQFLANDRIIISYEDGHTLGSVTYKIVDPSDPSTWVKQ